MFNTQVFTIIGIFGYFLCNIVGKKSHFNLTKCEKCDLDMSYGEYVRFVAHNEAKYSDILGDYTGSTEGETAGTLDEWED